MISISPKSTFSFWKSSMTRGRHTTASRSFRASGDSLRDAGQFAKAAEAYGKYLEQNSDDFDIWVQKGNCLKDSGYLSEAKDAYASALELRTDNADLYLQMGHLAKLSGNLVGAFEAYGKSFEISQSENAATEIKNVKGLLDKRSEQIGPIQENLLQTPAGTGASQPIPAPAIHGLAHTDNDEVPIKMMTLLPTTIGIFNRKSELNHKIEEVSRFISKQSTNRPGRS